MVKLYNTYGKITRINKLLKNQSYILFFCIVYYKYAQYFINQVDC